MCRNCIKPKRMLIINHELQESATFITPWTVAGIGTCCFISGMMWEVARGHWELLMFGHKWSSPTNQRAAQTKTQRRVLTGSLVRVNGNNTEMIQSFGYRFSESLIWVLFMC